MIQKAVGVTLARAAWMLRMSKRAMSALVDAVLLAGVDEGFEEAGATVRVSLVMQIVFDSAGAGQSTFVACGGCDGGENIDQELSETPVEISSRCTNISFVFKLKLTLHTRSHRVRGGRRTGLWVHRSHQSLQASIHLEAMPLDALGASWARCQAFYRV